MKRKGFQKKCMTAGILFALAAAPAALGCFQNVDCGVTVQAAEKKIRVNKYGVLMDCKINGNLYLSDSISAIDKFALDFVKVTAFQVSGSNSCFRCIDGVLFSKDGTKLIRVPSERTGSYTVPAGVTAIAQNAFRNCGKLQSISIPESVTVIGSSSFSGCKSLENINLPSRLTRLCGEMFCNCYSLKSISIPSGVKKLGASAFENCSSLSSVVLPSGLEEIPSCAFANCAALKEVRLPEKLQEVGYAAFQDCTSLASISFNKKLEYIRDRAFSGCVSLEKLVLPDSLEEISYYSFMNCTNLKQVFIPDSLEKIPDTAFDRSAQAFYVDRKNVKYSSQDGVLFNKDKTKLIQYPYSKEGDYQMPDSVEKIEESAFESCVGIGAVIISPKITTLSLNIFQNSSVTKLVLPESVTKLDALYGGMSLSQLKEVVLSGKNEAFAVYNKALYSKDLKTLCIYPQGAGGTMKFPKEAKELDYISANNQAERFEVEKGSESFATDDGVLTNLKKTKVLSVPARLSSYTLGRDIRKVSAFSAAKPYLSNLKYFQVKKGNDYFKAVDGVLFDKSGSTLVEFPNAKEGKYTISGNVNYIRNKDAFSYASGLSRLNICSGMKDCRLYFRDCPKLTGIYVNDASLRKASLYFYGSTKPEKMGFSSYLVSTKLYFEPQCKEKLTIYACSGTKVEKLAKKQEIPFVSIGYVPAKLKNVSLKAFYSPNRVLLSWSGDPNVAGYEIYTENGRVRDIKNCNVTQADIYVGSRYYTELYVRSYSYIRGKKVYGEPVRVVYL